MTPAIDLRPDHRKIVEDILEDHLPDGVNVWVFGSRAEWTTKESSDLDLALDGDGPLEPRIVMALDLAFEASLLPFRVDVVDLARVEDGFRETVEANRTPWRRGAIASHDWIQGALADACKAIDYGLTTSASPDSRGPKFLRITDIVSGHIDWPSVPYANVDEATRAKYRLYDGDIVIARTGASTGASAFVKAPPDAVFASYLVRLQARKGYDARFLAYFLKSVQFWNYLGGVLGDKSAQPNASAATMTAAPLRAPGSRSEQRAIGGVLGALDDRIELNRRMNETLEAMARAFFKSWFVDFDPVRAKIEGRDTGLPNELAALFPSGFVDSESGEIPEGWRVVCINDVCKLVQNGGTPRRAEPRYWKGDIDWFKTSELDDGPLLTSEERISSDGLRESSCKLWPAGTVLVALYASPTVGRLGILETAATANQACSALVAGADFGTLFLFYSLLFSRRHLRTIAVGAAQQNISQDVVRRHRIVVPPSRVARVFESAIHDLYERRVAYLRERRVLSTLRDTLLPALVSGEVRLPTALVARYAESDQHVAS